MLFSSQLPLGAVVQWCRALKHGVDIGLSPVKIFRQQAKSGPTAGRALAAAVAERVAGGESLADALRAHRVRFPTLFVELVAVGEETGRLTETFEVLEDYYVTAVSSRKQFLAALVWPLFMYGSAVGVIALMLLVLGMLAPPGGKAFDPLGLGLTGVRGATIWLAAAGAVSGAAGLTFLYVRESESLRAKVESAGLNVPGLADCFRAFALQRFAVTLHMAAEAGLKADRALKLSFRATANAAYTRAGETAAKKARKGEAIAPILTAAGHTLFPDEFLDSVHVGEESGRLAEVMARQAAAYRDEAVRRTKFLTSLAGGLVYAAVGLMVIVIIGRMVMSIAGIYDDALRGI